MARVRIRILCRVRIADTIAETMGSATSMIITSVTRPNIMVTWKACVILVTPTDTCDAGKVVQEDIS